MMSTYEHLVLPEGGSDHNASERAYLRRRASQEMAWAIGTEQPEARIPHHQMAKTYCRRCQAIRNPDECEACALRLLCRRLVEPQRD